MRSPAEIMLEAPGGAIALARETEAMADAWEALAARTSASVYQHPGFVLTWAHHRSGALGLQPIYFTARRNGELLGVLPLALGREAGMKMLVALSDSHTNINGGVFDPRFDAAPEALQHGLFSLVPRAEGLSLCCVPATDGRHPLLAMPQPSVHDAHGGDLSAGIDAHVARNSGKRKRKRHRQAIKRYDAAGGWQVRRAATPGEAVAWLDEARGWFAERFAEEGIADPFAPASVRSFMADALAASCGADRPAMAIWSLEVNGERLAIQAGGGGRDQFSLMFMAYRSTRFDDTAPGNFLLHEVLAAAAADGYARFDLGRGREPYKMSWCDVTIPLHDVRVGRTARAKLYMTVHAGASALKKRVRENERLWAIAKTLRRSVGR